MTRETIRGRQDQGPRKTRSIDTEQEEKPPVTCEICFEPMNRKFKNNRCSHPFCTDCITSYIKAKLDHHQGKIKCPDLNCCQFLDPISCRTVIGPSLVVKWCDVLCKSAIAGVNKCYCPNRDCNALILNECGGIVKKAQCPNCNTRFCFNCQRDWSPWHSWSRCEYEDADDEAFNRLMAERKWRRCPQCRFFVEPVFGRRFILCRCGISFCYDCGIDTSDVAHHCIEPVGVDWMLFFRDLINYSLVFTLLLALFCSFIKG